LSQARLSCGAPSLANGVSKGGLPVPPPRSGGRPGRGSTPIATRRTLRITSESPRLSWSTTSPLTSASELDTICWHSTQLDGQDILPALRGESVELIWQRFWQWNRYPPVLACNASMRDGPWKLVRPPVRAGMTCLPADSETDRAMKYEPETFRDISRESLPTHKVTPAPLKLFHVETDVLEKGDLAAAEQDRVARMLASLEDWFADVEGDRMRIRDGQPGSPSLT